MTKEKAQKPAKAPLDAQLRACERQLLASRTTTDRLDVLEERFEILVDILVPVGAWRANVSRKEGAKKAAWRRMSPEEQKLWVKEGAAAHDRLYGPPPWAE